MNEKKLFELANRMDNTSEQQQGESLSFWKDVRLRFSKNRAAVVCLIILLSIFVLMFILPAFGAYGPANYSGELQNTDYAYQPPFTFIDGKFFFLGTDLFGRDMFVRIFKGAQISIFFGITAALFDLVIGVTLGGISGYFGGKIDYFIQRITEILGAVPFIVWVVVLIIYLGPGFWTLIFALAITGWIPMYRIVRAQTMKYKEQEFVLASITLGAKPSRIISSHIIPNILGIIIVWLMFTIPAAIFTEAFLSFIGLGLKVPLASLGTLVSDGKDMLRNYPYLLMIPATILSVIMLCFNLVGDGLRDAFDPKMRGGK
ncbi:MAG: ABC transporter permease [Mycoplasmatales bacterium]